MRGCMSARTHMHAPRQLQHSRIQVHESMRMPSASLDLILKYRAIREAVLLLLLEVVVVLLVLLGLVRVVLIP